MRDALSSGSINLATRMGSVKSAHRRAGKVKGIDRFLGTLETASQELMETSSGEIEIKNLVQTTVSINGSPNSEVREYYVQLQQALVIRIF